MRTVSIVGAGRVGGALALSLPPDKYRIENLIINDKRPAGAVTTAIDPSANIRRLDEIGSLESDIIFITTQDSNIPDAATAVCAKLRSGAAIFHTSGAFDSSVLSHLAGEGPFTGSMHPLVSVSRPELGPERFQGAFFCIEGVETAVAIAKEIVLDLGGRPFTIDTKFKTLYHAAAVTACGHLVALFDASVEMMTKCGLDGEQAKEILMPLVLSTVDNLNEQDTAAALTGTFARADIETFTRHLTALNENVSDELLEIYLLLGERSLELAARQGVSADRIDRLRTKVSIAKSKLKW
jgi:predicted short-subunit dehydrogenase-like oxidoreductase (DUF2520 family)